MTDPTEGTRMQQQAALNAEAADASDPQTELGAKYGQLWDTGEFQKDYTVHSFLAPYVSVTRKSDKLRGTLLFSHSPRFYHSFQPE